MKVTRKYHEAKDGSLHLTKKLRNKHNKIMDFMNSTKEICITVRQGVTPRIFDNQSNALSWVKSVSSEHIVDSYSYETIKLPIHELISISDNNDNLPIFGKDSKNESK